MFAVRHALTSTFITPYALDTVAQFPGWLPLAVRSLPAARTSNGLVHWYSGRPEGYMQVRERDLQQVKAEEQKDVGMVKSEEEVTGRVMKCEVKDEAEDEKGIGNVKCEEEVMGMAKAEAPADRSAASVDH